MTTPAPQPGSAPPGDRLERALAAYLAAPPTTAGEVDELLASNPELAELLTPMVDPGAADAQSSDGHGERVLGDFRLVREIGRGGMGIVWEAWQRSLDRRVAVKVLGGGLVANPGAVARFRREASAAARLRHPHVVEVFGFGSDAGEHFFAMQFVDGKPLHDVAERFHSPADAVALAAQLADALQHAHAAGLVHRDVKPGNVLVRDDGTALLTDFGVARDEALPSLTRDGGFVGTLDYASPEQVRGEAVDPRTDVWAVGVILHELLSGAHPFTASTQQATLHRILSAEPPQLQGLPGVSDDLAAVVDRALAKKREHRYGSAAALLADLRALQRGEPVTVRLPTGFERARRWATREPWRAFAAVVLLLAVPVVTGVLGYLWANAGRIEAATAAEARDHREDLLSRALLMRFVDGEPEEGLAMLATVPDPDVEVAIQRALLLYVLDKVADAHAALAGSSGPVVELVDKYLDQPQGAFELLDELPDNAFECFVRALILFDSASHRGHGSRPKYQRSVEMAYLAVTLAPAPRLGYLIMLANAAKNADDTVVFAGAVRALELQFPDAVASLIVRARAYERRRPELSLALADRLIAQQPDVQLHRIQRGVALEQMNRLDEAAEEYRRVIGVVPGNADAWSSLSAVLRKQKRVDEAVAAARRAIEIRPQHASFRNMLALALRDAGKTAEAKEAFEQALELRSDFTGAAYNLGNLLMRGGDVEGAIAAFRRAVARDPGDARANANLADALSKAGRNDEALPFAMRASESAPGDLIPNYNAASLALKLGLPRLALGYAQKARAAGKDDANGLSIHASALLAQEKVDDAAAQEALTEARSADEKRGGKNLDDRLLLARALAAAGDREGAIGVLDQARANPRFAKDGDRKKIDEQMERVRGGGGK